MKYNLMHKNIEVAQLEIIDGSIEKVIAINNKNHLPIGTYMGSQDMINTTELERWWSSRYIPTTRAGIEYILETLGYNSIKQLAIKNNGFSLSDHYWIKEVGHNVSWEDLNFFTNKFSEDFGDYLFNENFSNDVDLHSPDISSDGYLPKRWKILNNKRVLFKGGSDIAYQQPFNEVVVSKIAKELNINCVDYELIWHKQKPYSLCECFTDENLEIVTAYSLNQTIKKDNKVSDFEHTINCAKNVGLDIREDLNKMIVLDYIVSNTDRHYNNFGYLRDSNTLEFKGFTPIFDTGSCLGYNQVFINNEVVSKPFNKSFDKQLQLVGNLNWIDLDSLKQNYENIIDVVLNKENMKLLYNENRIEKIKDLLAGNLKGLEKKKMISLDSKIEMVRDKVESQKRREKDYDIEL